MIAYISGKIIHKDIKYVVVLTGGLDQVTDMATVPAGGGIGYKVYCTPEDQQKMTLGESGAFWIHTIVREDAFDLYGFTTRDSLSFFELLLTVSGIGPKSALGVLNVANISTLREAITTGETGYLTKISGIGKKVAEKIVLELKGKVHAGEEEFSNNKVTKSGIDALEALKSLGYTHKESKEALEQISPDLKDPGEMVKAALRILGM